MDPSVLGLPGPLCPGKGLLATLRETTSQGGVRWRGLRGGIAGSGVLRGTSSSWSLRGWVVLAEPAPLLHEGVSWVKARGKVGNQALEARAPPATPQEPCPNHRPPVTAHPTGHVRPGWPSWGQVAVAILSWECGTVPQIHPWMQGLRK